MKTTRDCFISLRSGIQDWACKEVRSWATSTSWAACSSRDNLSFPSNFFGLMFRSISFSGRLVHVDYDNPIFIFLLCLKSALGRSFRSEYWGQVCILGIGSFIWGLELCRDLFVETFSRYHSAFAQVAFALSHWLYHFSSLPLDGLKLNVKRLTSCNLLGIRCVWSSGVVIQAVWRSLQWKLTQQVIINSSM